MRLVNASRQTLVAESVEIAQGFWAQGRGLLGRSPPRPGWGLWLKPCRAIHTMGLNFAIDVVLLDTDLQVVAIRPQLAPWRLGPWHRRTHSILELGAGSLTRCGTAPGDRLVYHTPGS